jgi:trk system potassium uptake protein TrkH
MALGFGAAILLGTLILCLPAATRDGTALSTLTALFTATSATCVTGLSVIDIGTRLSPLGQLTVLALIQLGGLGITVFGTFMLVLLGQRLSVRNEFAVMDVYGVESVRGLRSLVLWTLGFTLFFEGLGTLVLWSRPGNPASVGTLPHNISPRLFDAFFHAVSAFCNAGFSLHGDSLTGFRSDPVYVAVIGILILAGGIGFLVLFNFVSLRFWRRNLKTRGRLTLHTRTVLTATAVLIVAGTLFFLIQERANTLAGLPAGTRWVCALFQSITPRTAGFNIVPMGQIHEHTRFLTILLMLVGGSPGSAAGGVKTTTLAVLIATVVSLCQGHRETVLFGRTLPHAVVRESLVIITLFGTLILTAYGLLLWTEMPLRPGDASALFFETVSASATVGLSIDRTPSLSAAGRCVMIFCMVAGRLGPLTLAHLIGTRDREPLIRYPTEDLVVG